MIDSKKEQIRSKLFSSIRRITSTMRGSYWYFNQYFIGLLFYRFISESICSFINNHQRKAGDNNFNYAVLSEKDAERYRKLILKEKGFFIQPSELFENISNKKANIKNLNETLERVFKNIEKSAVSTSNKCNMSGLFAELDFKNPKLGNSNISRNQVLFKIFDNISVIPLEYCNDNSMNLYGDAFKYLITNYATSGRGAGEFYTPHEVSELLARITIADKKEVNKVYDPACGTGSLLLQFAKILGKENVHDGFYGQEINFSNYNMCKINMFLNDLNYQQFNIAHGNTLTDPQHSDDQPFEAIVSNPPYSLRWDGEDNPKLINDDRFTPAGILPPKSKADFAFVLHVLSCLATNGIAAIVLIPGVMYRGGREKKIRKFLIDNNYVEAVIQLSANLLFDTSMGSCILVLKRNKIDKNVLFIDASNEFVADSKMNKLNNEHINKILDCYINRKSQDYFSSLTEFEKIVDNDYNISVGFYVESKSTNDDINIIEVNTDIEKNVAEQNKLRKQINMILSELGRVIQYERQS